MKTALNICVAAVWIAGVIQFFRLPHDYWTTRGRQRWWWFILCFFVAWSYAGVVVPVGPVTFWVVYLVDRFRSSEANRIGATG